ncbi:MAG: hypothetical protein HC850_17625 [Rhodomicrobium sp.]|nr:hypothetical protein [Rhodomicrobium sp.]
MDTRVIFDRESNKADFSERHKEAGGKLGVAGASGLCLDPVPAARQPWHGQRRAGASGALSGTSASVLQCAAAALPVTSAVAMPLRLAARRADSATGRTLAVVRPSAFATPSFRSPCARLHWIRW